MRAIRFMSARSVASVAVLSVAALAAANAQLPNSSAAAFGMAGNFTAIARGYEAVAWNPANLAMPERPFISVGALIQGGSLGMDPIDFKMLHEFSGKLIPDSTKSEWLDQVRLSGGQHARIDAGLTPLALSVGPVGLQLGATTYGNIDLAP